MILVHEDVELAISIMEQLRQALLLQAGSTGPMRLDHSTVEGWNLAELLTALMVAKEALRELAYTLR